MLDAMFEEEFDLKINMEVILDITNSMFKEVSSLNNDDRKMNSIRIFRKQNKILPEYLYIANIESFDENYLLEEKNSFIIVGTPLMEPSQILASVIFVPDYYNYLDVFEYLLQYFEKFNHWKSTLQIALNNDAGISKLCELSIDFLENPLFVHDDQFYMISCPRWLTGMIEWETESKTGRKLPPVSIINDFKIDKEYIQTLQTNGAQIFSEKLRGYRILYVNIRNEQKYEGRLCICELQTPFKPIHYIAAEYLVKLFVKSINKCSLYRESFSSTFENFFINMLNNSISDNNQIEKHLSNLNWKMYDDYLCVKMGIEHRDVDILSTETTFHYIESHIGGSFSFLYEGEIAIIVNLTVGKNTRGEVLSKLAFLLREGLFKAGSSTVFHDFIKIADYYKQACVSLEYGKRSNSMGWHYEFENFAIRYICENASGQFSKEIICSDKLQILKKYDQENNTSLYKTLAIYLKNDKNIMKTARELYIHRSTLFYRLERIHKLTEIDLEDTLSRIYITISYLMLEGIDECMDLLK